MRSVADAAFGRRESMPPLGNWSPPPNLETRPSSRPAHHRHRRHRGRGITVERVLPVNGACWRPSLWKRTCAEVGITLNKTRPTGRGPTGGSKASHTLNTPRTSRAGSAISGRASPAAAQRCLTCTPFVSGTRHLPRSNHRGLGLRLKAYRVELSITGGAHHYADLALDGSGSFDRRRPSCQGSVTHSP